MSFAKTAAVFAASTIILSTVAVAGSHSSKPPAVKARQAHMQLYVHNLGILGAMAKGEVEYNADAASGAASNLAALSSLYQGSYWAPGTDTDSIEGTRALPALWAADSTARELGGQLADATAALAAVAGSVLTGGGAEVPPADLAARVDRAFRSPTPSEER